MNDDEAIAAIGSAAEGDGDGGERAAFRQNQQQGRRGARNDASNRDGGDGADGYGGFEGSTHAEGRERGGGADLDMDHSGGRAVHDQSSGERFHADVRIRDPRLVFLDIATIRKHAAEVLPWIERVAKNSNRRFSVDGVASEIESGNWQLWAVVTDHIAAVIGTTIQYEVSGLRVMSVIFATGTEARLWRHLVSGFEAWARSQGCQRVDMWARKGWARHLKDYRLTHVLLEKDL